MSFWTYLRSWFISSHDFTGFGASVLLPRLKLLSRHHPWHHNFALEEYLSWKGRLVEGIGYMVLPWGEVGTEEIYQLNKAGLSYGEILLEYPLLREEDVEYSRWYHHEKFCVDLEKIIYSLENVEKARKGKDLRLKLQVQEGLDLLGQYFQSLWW